jgi:ElaB/YqjD/DUF883 family membrane-anchored ribosome-binding protein
MAEVERSAGGRARGVAAGIDLENLPALLGKLGDDVMRLVDTKLSLVKVELKEDASFYARNGAFTAVGAMVALIGFALVNVAVAFFISNFFANDAARPPSVHADELRARLPHHGRPLRRHRRRHRAHDEEQAGRLQPGADDDPRRDQKGQAMAEERNVGLARASESADDDVDQTKAALQRRMEEARESISQTVSEIKDTVVTQYQQVKENISDTLDWREQYKRHTLPFTVGAFAVGALLGYGVMGAFKGGDERRRLRPHREEGSRALAQPVLGARRALLRAARAGSIASRARSSRAESDEDVGPSPRPSYSSGYSAPTAPQAQGLASYAQPSQPAARGGRSRRGRASSNASRRRRLTTAQDELSTVGERVVEELSRTAQSVVVPDAAEQAQESYRHRPLVAAQRLSTARQPTGVEHGH